MAEVLGAQQRRRFGAALAVVSASVLGMCSVGLGSARADGAGAVPSPSEVPVPKSAPSAAPTLTAMPTGLKLHAFTLAECLDLADKNAPQLWAARARLAQVHAQLDEVKWTPFSQFSAQAGF